MKTRLVIALALSVCGAASGATKVMSDVPGYLWTGGCGPTAIGMIMGYWDAHGYRNLIPGSNSWETNAAAIENCIASSGYNRDYGATPDRVATPSDPYHADDCIADFTKCSRGSLDYGWSNFSDQGVGMAIYAASRGYGGRASNVLYSGNGSALWGDVVAQIDVGDPSELLVDSDGDGVSDHFVAAVGYDTATKEYACLNTYTQNVTWDNFTGVGTKYGVYGAWFFDPGSSDIPGDSNFDGAVTDSDYTIWASHYGAKGTWETGDWNGDGTVNDADYTLWADNYTPGMTVPEPVTAGMALLGMLFIRPRR